MPKYTLVEYHDLERDAENATPTEQSHALALVASVLDANSISYAVTGAMNLYLRGSRRMSGPVTIALHADECCVEEVLDVFTGHKGIYRPSDKMLQTFKNLNGTSKVYVDIHGKLVRIDLKTKGDEVDVVRYHPAVSIDRVTIKTKTVAFDCNLLAIKLASAFALKTHFKTEATTDYQNLMFLCRSPAWAPQVREAAGDLPPQWKTTFLKKVFKRHPTDEVQVRWALDMWPVGTKQPPQIGFGAGGAVALKEVAVIKRNRNTPRDGDKSKDGYWTYNGKHEVWYHKHQDGRYSLEGMCL